jgi:hypothetical protein
MTNENQLNPNQILLSYLKNIAIGSFIAPSYESSNVRTYWIGNQGKYFVKGLIDDPMNSYYAYLFTTDNNVASGTFGVFKMDFSLSTPNYSYKELFMSSG